jgi:hypothetical protein
MRERAVKPLTTLVERDSDVEKSSAGITALNWLSTGYVERGVPGLNEAAEKMKLDYTREWRKQAEVLTSVLKAQSAQLAECETQNQQLRATNASIQQAITETEGRCATLEAKARALEAEHDHQRAEWTNNADLVAQNRSMKELYEESVSHSTGLESRIGEDEALIADLHAKLVGAEAKRAEAETLAKMKEEALNEVRSNLAASVADVANMTAVLATERSEKLVLEQNLAASAERIRTSSTELEIERDKKSGLVLLNTELEHRVQQEERLSSDLRAEQQKLEKRLRDLKEGAQKKLNELAGLNARLERVAAADSREQARLRLELSKATVQLEELKQEKFALSKQLPPKVPTDEDRAFFLLDVRKGEVAYSGTTAECEKFVGFHPEQEAFLMRVDASMLTGWRINQIMSDPSVCAMFIDKELADLTNITDLPRLLTARFPEFEDLIPETVQRLKAFSFAHLQSMQQKRQRGAALEQPVTVAR